MTKEATFGTAFKFHTLGRCVIPSGGGKKGKAALVKWTPYQRARPDDSQLEHWQRSLTPAVWAMVTGQVSGCFVIDCDTTEAIVMMGSLKPHIRTPHGGCHYYVHYPDFPIQTKAGILPGVDVRGEGGYVNFAGGNGKADYQVEILPVEDTLYTMAQLPAKLQLALKPKPKLTDRLLQQATERAKPDETRNQTGFELACQLRDAGLSQAEAEVTMLRYVAYVGKSGKDPYTEREAIDSLEQAYRRPAREPWGLPKAKTEGIPAMKSLQEMRDAIANEPEADDLIQDLLPHSNSAYMLIAGRSGIGKTFLLLNILYCLASGISFMSRKTKKCKVGYLSLEGDHKKILKRFNTIGLSFPGAEDNIFWEHRMPFRLNSQGVDWLTAKVDGLDVIGIDPLRPLVPGDYTVPKDVSAFIENLRIVQNKTGVVVIGTHHIRKPDKRIKVQPEDLLFEIKGASEYVESATSVLLLERGNQPRGQFGKFGTNTSLKNLHFVKIKDAPAEPVPLTLRFNAETLLFEPVDELFGDEGVNGGNS